MQKFHFQGIVIGICDSLKTANLEWLKMSLRMIHNDFLIFYTLNIMILKIKKNDHFVNTAQKMKKSLMENFIFCAV